MSHFHVFTIQILSGRRLGSQRSTIALALVQKGVRTRTWEPGAASAVQANPKFRALRARAKLKFREESGVPANSCRSWAGKIEGSRPHGPKSLLRELAGELT